MALYKINKLNYAGFVTYLENAPNLMIELFDKCQYGNWMDALKRYKFDGYDYKTGYNLRLEYNKKLRSAQGVQIFNVANEILHWGSMKDLNEAMKQNLPISLKVLDEMAINQIVQPNLIYTDRIASMSKIYEMWDLEYWIIFDSYCAKGLQWIVKLYWNHLGYIKHDNVLRLPWPVGRVGSPLDGFPRLGTPNQALLGFLYASWLCKRIAELLNQQSNNVFEWKACHIEMLAFQLGHDV